jgi:hypothetical protein
MVRANLTALAATASAVVADPEPEAAPTSEAPVEKMEVPTETPAETVAA